MTKKKKLNKNRVTDIKKKQAQQVKKKGAKPVKITHLTKTVFSAKTGMETITTTEFRNGKARKSTTITREAIIYENGQIVNKKAYKALEYANSKGRDRGLKFRQTIRKWRSDSKIKGSISARSMMATLIENDIERMLFNQNKPLNLIAAEAGASEQDLLDPTNWNGSVFTNPATGEKFKFEFRYNYDGSTNMIRI